ncbi:UDP-N-acetylglucosamine 2-epimerase (non-hydrolyzing) [Gramella lutea]|uniref:UDP-N-acetylglucosamine 2-epimerase (Non-hydrolyzing) n=1 Tax=Christiangramia lutea TaxID=1607951 RepID=A0A9X1V1L6_9FLAO|nr:UDP-N-acetylglucosamine 2-epimerase (non-hydrolyzing) [Christiangramia lutea]MCH4821976.1 UDP-N-acetylglucosamine 2-epimerase (non-hydrolyzing) [Christiangramia lutea]
MLKILTIVGARPQIIKAAALSRAIREDYSETIEEVIVHTGQHYDENMSKIFFEELQIPEPNYNLNVGSGLHGAQTAAMIQGIENVLNDENPDCIILYGDTNSTLAGAIAASKIHVPVVHIEAGLRSFNKAMPEEINRIMCDHVSTYLFSPTKTGYQNLLKEGFKENINDANIDNPAVFHCGDVMYDNSLYFSRISDEKSDIIKDLELENKEYVLVTVHRNNNTDDPQRLSQIFDGLIDIVKEFKINIVLPLHPRTREKLKSLTEEVLEFIQNNEHFKIVDPVSFLDMIQLEKRAELIITDSGGVQKEAYFFKKPALVMRKETEWVEIIEAGAGVLIDSEKELMKKSFSKFYKAEIDFPQIFGNGKAANFICERLISNHSS